MKTITFYSYKGGVGRTLALANIAKRLAEFGKKVCVIDFDLEAPGLHQKFSNNINKKDIKAGIVDYIYEFLHENNPPKSIKGFTTKIKFKSENIKDIDLITAGNIYSKEYWKKLSLINWGSLFYEKDSQGVAFFIDLKQKIEKELKPDFLLIDSRTGITDISGITMSILADELVLLIAKNEENIEGIVQIIETLSIPENSFKEGIPKINLVLSRIPYFSEPKEKYKEFNAKNYVLGTVNNYLRNCNSSFQLDKILVIHSDPELELDEKFKIAYEHDKISNKDEIPIATDYLTLFDEITNDVLSEEEKKKFNTLRKSEQLIEQAKKNHDNAMKIKLLKEAIVLNATSSEAYSELAVSYHIIKDYGEAIKNIRKAIRINPLDLKYQNVAGILNIRLNKLSEAEKIYRKILVVDEKYYDALFNLGYIFTHRGDYPEALKYYERVVILYPHYHEVHNATGNIYRLMKDYDKAFDYIYKALELNPRSAMATGTLAEIYADQGNEREFYKNLELSFSFGMNEEDFNRILQDESVYKSYLNEKKFLDILEKYNIKILKENT